MHCPRCGQQVVSAEIRFCKRCGFALDGVKGLLAPSASGHESPPGMLNITVGADPRSLRGLNQAAYLLLLAFVPFLLAAAEGLFNFALLAPMLLLKIFFALLTLPALRFGYALYEAKKEWRPQSGRRLGGGEHAPRVPASQGEPVAGVIGRRTHTAEATRPLTVTEATTRSLKPPRGRSQSPPL